MSVTRNRRGPLRARACALLLLPLSFVSAPSVAQESNSKEATAVSASQVIDELDSGLLDIMRRASKLGYAGRYEAIAPAVRKAFDFAFMARHTIGRHWKGLSERDRRRWVATFEDFTVSNFADRFDGYSGERFEIRGEKPASHATRVVLTRLRRPNADDVEIDYRMRQTQGTWKVVDVYSDGKVSEVALRRSEYAGLLTQGGIEKLIASVRSTVERQARE